MPTLPPLFPDLGPATLFVLVADFADIPPPPISAWDDELNVLVEHRLTGTALRLIRQKSLPVRRDTARALQARTFDWSVLTSTLTKTTVPYLDLLHDRIPFALIKGPGLAHFYPTLTERPFTDYDIVVAPSNFTNTLSFLRSQGFFEKERTCPPWPSFSRFCREAINLVHNDGARIDLHHHIPPWIWGRRLHPSTITAHATPTGPNALPIASPLDNYFVAALHILSDHDFPGQTLRAWRDVLTLTKRLDPQEIASTAFRLQLSGLLRWILLSLPAPVRPGSLISNLRGARLEHFCRIAVRRSGSTFRRGPLTYPTRLPLPNALYYAFGMAFPPRPYLQSRYPDTRHPRFAWWLTGLRDVPRPLPRPLSAPSHGPQF